MKKNLFRYLLPLCIPCLAGLYACSSDDTSAVSIESPIADSSQAITSSATTDQANTPTSSPDSPTSSEISPESSSEGLPANSSSSNTANSSSSREELKESSSSDNTITSSESTIESSSSSATPYFWNDDFEGTAIDTSKWTFETGATGWGNNEWEYYTARTENAYVQDGILHIRANKESYEGASYTSARLITKGKFSFTYGTIEARIALPLGKGIWPAFWMLGENIGDVNWPACGEIDIIEAVNNENIVYGTNHWAYEGQHAEYGNKTSDYYGTSIALDITQFHTYRLTWDEKVIAMYVDDFKYHEISIENSAGGTDAFHKPFFLLLNIAVAGNWPGFEVDDAQFPNEMLVDYIRVYK